MPNTSLKKKLLTFGQGNAKLDKGIATFSIPAGWTCPGAKDCLARASKDGKKLTQAPNTKFRCFSASMEVVFPNVRESRWDNFNLLKGKSRDEMAALIQASIPEHSYVIRLHVSGDFFSQDYFDAWVKVARDNPRKTFYGYSKSLPFWVKRIATLPSNFILNASLGGKFDELTEEYKLKTAEVVFSVKEAKTKGLKIDHNDDLAWKQNKSFALLVHGTQAAKSLAGKAVSALRLIGLGGYAR